MPTMKALAAQSFAGRNIAQGEEFDATHQEARLLVGLKRAVIAGVETTPKVDAVAPAKRRYKRRDLNAAQYQTK